MQHEARLNVAQGMSLKLLTNAVPRLCLCHWRRCQKHSNINACSERATYLQMTWSRLAWAMQDDFATAAGSGQSEDQKIRALALRLVLRVND